MGNLEAKQAPIKYCLYARKSSEAEEKQALSIDSQIKEMILLYDSYHVITADHERELVSEKMEDFFSRALLNNA